MNTIQPRKGVSHLDDTEPRWFAVYTRYKREKMVHRRLTERHIQIYLPLRPVTRRYEGKVRELQLPLISCYLFTKITKKEYILVLEDPDVVQFVRPSKELIAIPEREIEILRRVTSGCLEVEVEPLGYEPGEAVEITGGPLAGLNGVFLEKKSSRNVVIELEKTGYSLHIQINPAMLRSMGQRR